MTIPTAKECRERAEQHRDKARRNPPMSYAQGFWDGKAKAYEEIATQLEAKETDE